jgi:hypothetical protein
MAFSEKTLQPRRYSWEGPYFLQKAAKKNPGCQNYQQPGKGKGMGSNRRF